MLFTFNCAGSEGLERPADAYRIPRACSAPLMQPPRSLCIARAGAASAHVADTCQSPSGRLLALTLSVGDFGLTFHAPDFQITFWKENFKIFSENPNQFFVH